MNRSIRKTQHERGVAMFLAIFALMLLAGVGLAMLYSASTETSVDTNFRDQQVATYGALAGLHEARERLIIGLDRGADDIAWPQGLPDPTKKNIVYIINPGPGQSFSDIQPWNPSNDYYDKELCTETLMSGFCTAGVPPSNSNWYRAIDNSDSSAGGSWKNATSPSYRWVRIQLKADNTITNHPTRTGADGTQVCWSGVKTEMGEAAAGANYNTDCSPKGAIDSITVIQGGHGYDPAAPPTVTISSPGSGITATATANIKVTSTDQVTSITLVNPGSGYTSNPTVTLSSPASGTTATATATYVKSGKSVETVGLTSPGSPQACYATDPSVSITGGGGGGATASPVMSNGQTCVASWKVSGSCSAQEGNSNVAVTSSGGGGSGFAGTVTFKKGGGKVDTYAITDPGSGYSTPPNITISGCNLAIAPVLGYQISSVQVTNGGSGYTSTPTVTVSAPSSGGLPTASATLGSASPNAGQINPYIQITNRGSGYSTAPTVTITGGGGSGATAVASLGGTGEIVGFTLGEHGSGYASTVPPTVTISGGGGTGAVAVANIAPTNWYGPVFLLTSYAETRKFGTRRGAQSMMQMEASYAPWVPPWNFQFGGAITLLGPDPAMDFPKSANYIVNGKDENSCGGVATNKPAIAISDQSALSTLITEATSGGSKPGNYQGSGSSTPDIEFLKSLEGADVKTLEDIMTRYRQAAQAIPGAYHSGNLSVSDWGTAQNPLFTFVDGDFQMGPNTGYGVLVVTGSITFKGNYTWNGPVIAIGQGQVDLGGGGSGTFNGALLVAKTRDSSGNLLATAGSPDINYNGGGTNTINYDHCWAENMISTISTPSATRPLGEPLKVLSLRTLSN